MAFFLLVPLRLQTDALQEEFRLLHIADHELYLFRAIHRQGFMVFIAEQFPWLVISSGGRAYSQHPAILDPYRKK